MLQSDMAEHIQICEQSEGRKPDMIDIAAQIAILIKEENPSFSVQLHRDLSSEEINIFLDSLFEQYQNLPDKSILKKLLIGFLTVDIISYHNIHEIDSGQVLISNTRDKGYELIIRIGTSNTFNGTVRTAAIGIDSHGIINGNVSYTLPNNTTLTHRKKINFNREDSVPNEVNQHDLDVLSRALQSVINRKTNK